MNEESRKCPRPGCTKTLDRSVFACGKHWFELPPKIRSEISRAWAGLRRGEERALERHQAACKTAEEWWAAA